MTRDDIISLINSRDFSAIENLQGKILECDNDGDGRESRMTIQVPLEDGTSLTVSLVGWYSSYGDGGWDQAFLSEPYTVTLTRYRPVS